MGDDRPLLSGVDVRVQCFDPRTGAPRGRDVAMRDVAVGVGAQGAALRLWAGKRDFALGRQLTQSSDPNHRLFTRFLGDGKMTVRARTGFQIMIDGGDPTHLAALAGRLCPEFRPPPPPPDSPVRRLSTKRVLSPQPHQAAGDDKRPGPPQQLSDEQQAVVDAVQRGESVFICGSGGCGKSFLLRHLLDRVLEPATTFATATTGAAACHIGGTTLHQFAGAGPGVRSAGDLLARVRRQRDAVARWRRARVLVVDEVSMLDADFFGWLEAVARAVRGVEAAFGGIQLVVCGDPLQLPPVGAKARFCFESPAWPGCRVRLMQLRAAFRQQAGSAFHAALEELRWGQCSAGTLRMLLSRVGADVDAGDGIRPTTLLTHRGDVERANLAELAALPGAARAFEAQDAGQRGLLRACAAPARLALKEGAQVMLIRSTGDGLPNGKRGVVVRFTPRLGLPVVRFADVAEEVLVRRVQWAVVVGGRTVATRSQLPLQLAWAVSIHKAQGLTLDRAVVGLSRVFEFGQAYVALSRVRSLSGLSLRGSFDRRVVRAHPGVVSFLGDGGSSVGV